MCRGIYPGPQVMCYESNLETARRCTNVNGYYFLKSVSLFTNWKGRKWLWGWQRRCESEPIGGAEERAGTGWPLLSLLRGHLDKASPGDGQREGILGESVGRLGGATVSFPACPPFLANTASRIVNYLFAVSIFLDQIYWETVLRLGDGYV